VQKVVDKSLPNFQGFSTFLALWKPLNSDHAEHYCVYWSNWICDLYLLLCIISTVDGYNHLIYHLIARTGTL